MKNFSTYIEELNEAQSEETWRLRQIKNKALAALNKAKKKGDAAEIAAAQDALDKAWADYNAGKEADKRAAGGSATQQVVNQPASTTSVPDLSSEPDFDKGYKEAIEALKQAQSGELSPDNLEDYDGQDDSLEIPKEAFPEDDENEGEGQEGQGAEGSGGGSGEEGDEEGEGGFSGGISSGKSRNSTSGNNVGVVRPEDCADVTGQLSGIPDISGGVITKEMGDAIAEAEGFDPDGGNQDSLNREWDDRADRAASQMQGMGTGWQKLRAKILSNKEINSQWKSILKKIVGKSINPIDHRRAFANKNVLISQDRIARTDKDKFDNVDYMMIWVDTSGSMSNKFLNWCITEAYGVACKIKPLSLVVVQFDDGIRDIQIFNGMNDLKRKLNKFDLKGGGGTNVKECFELFLKDKRFKRAAELVCIFTDGYLVQYKRDRRFINNLVWCVVGNPGFELQYKDPTTYKILIPASDANT